VFDENIKNAYFIQDAPTDTDTLLMMPFVKIDTTTNVRDNWKIVYKEYEKNKILILDLVSYALKNNDLCIDWGMLDSAVWEEANSLLINLNIINNVDIGPSKDSEGIITGIGKLAAVTYMVLKKSKEEGTTVFCIDNPANHLHPSWQKKLPMILEHLSKEYGLQFFVATHSPFIISAAAALGDETSLNNKGHSSPLSKVYFFEMGHVAGKQGKISTKGNDGYWGSKAIHISSMMLGAGLSDLIEEQEVIVSNTTPYIILCEGQGDRQDSTIYNIIFRDYEPGVLFISGRGANQTAKSFDILSQVKPGLSLDFEMLFLTDRDHYYATDADIIDYENKHIGRRVLRRRAIECYLFNSETAERILKAFNKQLLNRDRARLDSINIRVQKESEDGVQGNDYKKELESAFVDATRGFGSELTNGIIDDLPIVLARYVTPDTHSYMELEALLFGRRISASAKPHQQV
jgi:AAA domain, putative AbiEii toxin, Type IV TA system